MDAVFIKVLNMSLSATWLILAVLLLRLLLKKAPKWISVVLWGIVGLRLVLPFSLQSVFSLIPSAEVVSPSIGYAQHPAINSGVSFIDNAVNPTLGTSLAATPMNSVNPMQIVLYLGGLVWVGGIAVLLLYGLISYLRLRHKVAEAIPVEKNVWLCDQVKTPFILGMFRPRIYLPSGSNEEETAYVLAHERAHLRRKDHLWKPLGFLLLTVYWFNPLIWVAYILLCRDIEAACDEKVIADMEMTEKKAYANALVSCSMQRRLILACPLAFGEVSVKERVKGVLNYRKPSFWIILIAVIACIVLAVCLMTDPFSNKSLSGKLGVSMDMAVTEHNRSSKTEGRFAALDYDVLLVSKTANRTTVYAWVMYEEYSFDGTDVKEESGSHIPTVITFDTSSENSDESTYDVIEYWEPRDGSYYADDIRAKFPWSIRRKAFDVSGADRQHENCLRAAREYFGVGQNTAESSFTKFYLTIGADNVKSIVVTTPYTSGGCQNADGSLYRKGELIWLEPLDGYEDLRGVTITALDASETVIWTASVPNTEENRGFTRLTQDGWTISNLTNDAALSTFIPAPSTEPDIAPRPSPDASTSEQAPPFTISSGGVTVDPYCTLWYEKTWTENSWLIKGDPDNPTPAILPEDYDKIPTLTLADDFKVQYDHPQSYLCNIYDEQFRPLRNSWYGNTGVCWLEPGTYYCVIPAWGPQGRYIESEVAYEEILYHCVCRLIVPDGGAEPYTPEKVAEKAVGLIEARLHVADKDVVLTDADSLAKLEGWLENAEFLPGSAGCPFGSILTLTYADGSMVSCCPAEDSCGVIFSNGSYYRYAHDNEAFWALFGIKPGMQQ